MQKDDFLQKCKDEYKFNTHQLREVELGFENSLGFDKIEFYAKTKFNSHQMAEIRKGFENSLSFDEICKYAKNEYNSNQMYILRKAILSNFNLDEIYPLIDKTKFGWHQMSEIKEGFKDKLSLKKINLFAKSEFGNLRMAEIRDGFNHGLSYEKVSFYAKKEFSQKQMQNIKNLLLNDVKKSEIEKLILEKEKIKNKPTKKKKFIDRFKF